MPDLFLNKKTEILEIARSAIHAQLKGSDRPRWELLQELTIHRGCFVTLRMRGDLRGCVGTFDDSRPLGDNLVRMAVASAFQDGRFPAVTSPELPGLKIEISVLGPLIKVDDWSQILIGRDGVYVRFGSKSGTYLPDVAVEQKWDVPEFITRCAREKARMNPDECSKAEIYRYEVVKFSE